jgi:hypothetical protein
MTGVAKDHIPRLDIKVQRLLAFAQECDDLGLREVQYMTTRLSAEILQGRRRRLEMVTDTAEHGQTDRVYVQPSEPLDMWCSTQEAIRFMAQQQTEVIKCYQRDTKAHIKIPQDSTALRLKHECWPRRIPPNRFGGGRAASSAACVRHTYTPSTVAGQGYGAPEA